MESAREAAAPVARGHLLETEELAVEVGEIGEAAAEGDGGDGDIGFGEEAAGASDAEFVDEAGDGFACAGFEEAAEGSRAEVDEAGEVVEVDGFVEVLLDVLDDAVDAVFVAGVEFRSEAAAGDGVQFP